MKKRIIAVMLLISIFMTVTSAYAQSSELVLSVVKYEADPEVFEDGSAVLTKKIIESDSNTGEVTIELTLENTVEIEKTEIVIVVDNSGSMAQITSSQEPRRDIVVSAMQTIVEQTFDNADYVEMGLVRFADYGTYLPNATKVMSDLTSDKDIMLSAIDEFDNLYVTSTTITTSGYDVDTYRKCEGGTNIDAGLEKASEMFSSDATNKIVILLTDGVPTNAVGASVSSDVNQMTKQQLEIMENNGILTVSLMAGMLDASDASKQSIYEIFGTEENPTAGKFYNVSDDNIVSIVEDEILPEVLEVINQELTNIRIEDVFPDEIYNNFDFSYNQSPSKGNITTGIDVDTKSIVWDIDSLDFGETATVSYTLTLNDNASEAELLNKIIDTNEKVIVTYVDGKGNEMEETMEDSPQITFTKKEVADENDDNGETEDDNSQEGGEAEDDNSQEDEELEDGNSQEEDEEAEDDNIQEDEEAEDDNDDSNDTYSPKEPVEEDETVSGELPFTGTSIYGISISAVGVMSVLSFNNKRKYNWFK